MNQRQVVIILLRPLSAFWRKKIYRLGDILLRRDDILIRSSDIIIRPGGITIRPDVVIIRQEELVYRLDDILIRPDSLLYSPIRYTNKRLLLFILSFFWGGGRLESKVSPDSASLLLLWNIVRNRIFLSRHNVCKWPWNKQFKGTLNT